MVKGKDGKFRKEGQTAPLSDEDTKKWFIKAEPTTTPIGISNVKSGLGISELGEVEKQQLTQAVEAKKAEAEKAVPLLFRRPIR